MSVRELLFSSQPESHQKQTQTVLTQYEFMRLSRGHALLNGLKSSGSTYTRLLLLIEAIRKLSKATSSQFNKLLKSCFAKLST